MYGVPIATWRRNISHWYLNALSNSPLSGTSCQSAKKSNGFSMSGFQVGRGVFTRCCVLHPRRPATALPSVPSTWIDSSSSR